MYRHVVVTPDYQADQRKKIAGYFLILSDRSIVWLVLMDLLRISKRGFADHRHQFIFDRSQHHDDYVRGDIQKEKLIALIAKFTLLGKLIFIL